MSKNLLWLLVAAAFVMPLGCSSEEDEDTPPPPAPWGPNAIGVGDDAMIMVGSMGGMWTNVPAATSTINAAADLVKVVKVPNSNRLVAIANRTDATDVNAEIWYNNAGGTGAWTKASYGASEANLKAEHRAGAAATYDDWNLNDIIFLNSTEGYAVGSDYIILYTNDAGLTWTDLNVFQAAGASPVVFQEIVLTTDAPADFVPGATITGAVGSPAPSGTIIAVNEYWDTLTVLLAAGGTAFTTGQVTVTTNATISSVDNDDIWLYPTGTLTCLFGLQGTPGAATRGVHTLWMGTASQTSIPSGIWKITTDDPATAAARVFTVRGPDLGDQYGSGMVGYYGINALYFFDGSTGCAATDDGVWYTNSAATPAGLSYTRFAGTTGDDYYGFVYSSENTTTTGYLYSMLWVTGEEVPGRVAVTYTAGAPGTWSFGATPTWVEHADTTKYGTNYLNRTGFFLSSGKIFAFPVDTWTDGPWGWCGNYSDATMDNTMWQDTSEQYMGGTLANGNNSAYNKEIFQTGTTPTTGTVRWIAVR